MASFDSALASNPLLQTWDRTPHGLPPFHEIQPSHFESALVYAMEQHVQDVKNIVDDESTPSFDNTIARLDRSGSLFDKVSETFDNLCSSHGVPELQAVELKMASPLAAHHNQIITFPGLFAKIETIYNNRLNLGLTDEQITASTKVYTEALDPVLPQTAIKIMKKVYTTIQENAGGSIIKFMEVNSH